MESAELVEEEALVDVSVSVSASAAVDWVDRAVSSLAVPSVLVSSTVHAVSASPAAAMSVIVTWVTFARLMFATLTTFWWGCSGDRGEISIRWGHE